MDELIKAIVALYSASGGATLRAATPAGMWLSRAPQLLAGTYIVLTPLSAPEDFVMNSTASTIDAQVQWSINNITAGSDTLVVTAMGALRTLYHDTILTGMTGINCLMAKCNNGRGPFLDPDSEGYQYILEGKYMLGR